MLTNIYKACIRQHTKRVVMPWCVGCEVWGESGELRPLRPPLAIFFDFLDRARYPVDIISPLIYLYFGLPA
jgi:hypothetical protein